MAVGEWGEYFLSFLAYSRQMSTMSDDSPKGQGGAGIFGQRPVSERVQLEPRLGVGEHQGMAKRGGKGKMAARLMNGIYTGKQLSYFNMHQSQIAVHPPSPPEIQ